MTSKNVSKIIIKIISSFRCVPCDDGVRMRFTTLNIVRGCRKRRLIHVTSVQEKGTRNPILYQPVNQVQ